MDRKEFCEKLVETRKEAGASISTMVFALEVMPHEISRVEHGLNNFSIKKSVEYLYALKYMMVLRKHGSKKFGIIDAEQFGDWLKTTRADKISKSALARKIECLNLTISNIENKKSIVSIDTFLKIIQALGYEVTFEKIGA